MVETEKIEQRGQAVKRLRSLFDMHHVAFGAPENLGGVLVSLHDDRHFAMDFWSVMNALSSQETDAPSEEEMLETVIESATGAEVGELPEHEQPGVLELRQMLAGVDTARPAELPDAINKPNDALLLDHRATRSTDAKGGHEGSGTRVTQSIGDALARLEQTSRELREQLAALDKRAEGPNGSDAITSPNVATVTQPMARASETKVEALRAAPAMPELFDETAKRVPVVNQPMVPLSWEKEAAPAVASVPVSTVPKPVQARPVAGAEVFERKPAHQLSQRGLAIPDPDDDPSIVAPLSGYAAQLERGCGVRLAITAGVLAAIGLGGFFAARTDKGHSMLSSAGVSVQLAYAEAKDKLGLSAGKAQAVIPPKPDETNGSAAASPAVATDTHPAPVQSGATNPPPSPIATAEAKPAVTEPAPAAARPVQTPPAQIPPKKRTEELAIAAARSQALQQAAEVASAGVQRVPASTMAANLVSSRVPAYPEAAKAQEIEGPVELEVVITPIGTVKYAHAIDGDRHLRAAAEEAVVKWHYRPYIQNGSAIEVVTTARVDFRLP